MGQYSHKKLTLTNYNVISESPDRHYRLLNLTTHYIHPAVTIDYSQVIRSYLQAPRQSNSGFPFLMLGIKDYQISDQSSYCSNCKDYMVLYEHIVASMPTLSQSMRYNVQLGLEYQQERIEQIIDCVSIAIKQYHQLIDRLDRQVLNQREGIKLKRLNISPNNIYLKQFPLLGDPLLSQDAIDTEGINIQGYPSPQRINEQYANNRQFNYMDMQLFSIGLIALQLKCLNSKDSNLSEFAYNGFKKSLYLRNNQYSQFQINFPVIHRIVSRARSPRFKTKLQSLLSDKPSSRRRIYQMINSINNDKNRTDSFHQQNNARSYQPIKSLKDSIIYQKLPTNYKQEIDTRANQKWASHTNTKPFSQPSATMEKPSYSTNTLFSSTNTHFQSAYVPLQPNSSFSKSGLMTRPGTHYNVKFNNGGAFTNKSTDSIKNISYQPNYSFGQQYSSVRSCLPTFNSGYSLVASSSQKSNSFYPITNNSINPVPYTHFNGIPSPKQPISSRQKSDNKSEGSAQKIGSTGRILESNKSIKDASNASNSKEKIGSSHNSIVNSSGNIINSNQEIDINEIQIDNQAQNTSFKKPKEILSKIDMLNVHRKIYDSQTKSKDQMGQQGQLQQENYQKVDDFLYFNKKSPNQESFKEGSTRQQQRKTNSKQPFNSLQSRQSGHAQTASQQERVNEQMRQLDEYIALQQSVNYEQDKNNGSQHTHSTNKQAPESDHSDKIKPNLARFAVNANREKKQVQYTPYRPKAQKKNYSTINEVTQPDNSDDEALRSFGREDSHTRPIVHQNLEFVQEKVENRNEKNEGQGSRKSQQRIDSAEKIQGKKEKDQQGDKDDEEYQFVMEEYQIGTRYQGQKKNDKRNGKGTFYYREGGYYQGEWKDNKMHGKGRLYYPSGLLAYDGEWSEEEFDGNGKVYNDSPEEFATPFDYTNFNQIDEKWESYEGQLSHDMKDGKGTIVLANGEKYMGNFKDDRVHGEGKFYRLDGRCVHGIWENSLLKKVL